jgi:hypothetical protein
MSTPPSMATRAPALFEGWAMTNLPRRCAASVAARTRSTRITMIDWRDAQDPVNSLIPSAPRSRTVSTIAAVMAGFVASGRRAGNT